MSEFTRRPTIAIRITCYNRCVSDTSMTSYSPLKKNRSQWQIISTGWRGNTSSSFPSDFIAYLPMLSPRVPRPAMQHSFDSPFESCYIFRVSHIGSRSCHGTSPKFPVSVNIYILNSQFRPCSIPLVPRPVSATLHSPDFL